MTVAGDVVRTIELTPDESITDAIGRGHTLATAIADIIDNSLDAQAEQIRIRFVVEDDRLIAVRISDDGVGMVPSVLQKAMTLGKQHDRNDGALGHFGIGLKAASLSQAQTLTVYSQNVISPPCAMRIRRGSFTGEILDAATAEAGYGQDARGPVSTGTVVEWRHLETINQSRFPSGAPFMARGNHHLPGARTRAYVPSTYSRARHTNHHRYMGPRVGGRRSSANC